MPKRYDSGPLRLVIRLSSVLTQQQHKTHKNPFNFLGLPRTVRDKIYSYLLIKQVDASTQAVYEKHLTDHPDVLAIERITAVRRQAPDRSISLFSKSYYGHLNAARGLFLTSKQLHEEAAHCFFTGNTFGVELSADDPKNCWNIKNQDFCRIRDLTISIWNTSNLGDVIEAMEASGKLTFALLGLMSMLDGSGNTFDVLRIHYASCFRGQLEEIRNVLDATTKDHPRQVWVHDNGGRRPHTGMIQHCNFENVDSLFFFEVMLGPLEVLAGRVHDLAIVGDVSTDYIDKLTLKVMGGSENPRMAVRRAKELEAERLHRAGNQGCSQEELIQEVIAKGWKDPALGKLVTTMPRDFYVAPTLLNMYKDLHKLNRPGCKMGGKSVRPGFSCRCCCK